MDGYGQPTEVAFGDGKEAGVQKTELIERGKWTQLHEYPFDSSLKNMVVAARNEVQTMFCSLLCDRVFLLRVFFIRFAEQQECLCVVQGCA